MCVLLKLGHFGVYIRNAWNVVKCAAGGGWTRSADRVRNEANNQGGLEYPRENK